MRTPLRGSVALWGTAGLLAAASATAHDVAHRVVLAPEGGISVNGDQWVVGANSRVDGVCVFACLPGLGLGLHALVGIGGNHVTLRGSPRLSYTFWFADEDTIGLALGAGAGFIGFVPVGPFADFCDRTDLDGCGLFAVGFEWGGVLRVWHASLGATVGSGELPVLTVTATYEFELWESAK